MCEDSDEKEDSYGKVPNGASDGKEEEENARAEGCANAEEGGDDAGGNLFKDEDSNKTVFADEDPVRNVCRRCEGVFWGAGHREEGPLPTGSGSILSSDEKEI